MPRSGFPSMTGDRPTTLAFVVRSAPRMPGTARIAPMLTTGLDGASMTASAFVDRLEHSGRGLRLVRTDVRETVRGHLRPVADPPLLEVDCRSARRLGIGDHDVGLAAVVGDGQQAHARLPAVAQCLGDRGERISGAQHLGADEVGGDVAVAQAEPVRLRAVRGEFLLGIPRFADASPATLGVDAAAEGVHAGVEVGADAQAVHPDVVTDVDDRGDPVGASGFRVGAGGKPSSWRTP